MIIPDQIYRHFKGGLYLILAVALPEEGCEPVVVYKSLNGDNQVWTRSLAEFMSPVPKERGNPTGQLNRFELVKDVRNILSNCSTKNLIEELKRRPDSPFNEQDVEGLNSKVVSSEYVVGEYVYHLHNDPDRGTLLPLASVDTLDEAKKFMEHNPHRCSIRTKIFKSVLVEVDSFD